MNIGIISNPRLLINSKEFSLNPAPTTFGEILKFIQSEHPNIFLHDIKLTWENLNGEHNNLENDHDLDHFYSDFKNSHTNSPIKATILSSTFNKNLSNWDNTFLKFKQHFGWSSNSSTQNVWSNEEKRSFELIEEGKLFCTLCKGSGLCNYASCSNCKGVGFTPLPPGLDIILNFINYKFWKISNEVERHIQSFESNSKSTDSSYDFSKRNTHQFKGALQNSLDEEESFGLKECSSCKDWLPESPRYFCSQCANYEICQSCSRNSSHEHQLTKRPFINKKGNSTSKSHELVQKNSWNDYCNKKITQSSICPLKRPTLHVKVVSLKNPISVKSGDNYTADIAIKNESLTQAFPNGTFIINYDDCGKIGHKIPIPELGPGASFKFQLQANAPKRAGKSKSEWRFSTNDQIKSGIYFKEKIILDLDTQN